MKNITTGIWATCLLLTYTSIQLKAESEASKLSTDPVSITDSRESRALLARLDEIKAIEKSALSSPERKALRKEVRVIEKELKTMNGGIYFSVGAIIIIILLLILLL